MKRVLLTSCLLLTSLSLAKDDTDDYLPAMEESGKDTYTINFNNVSIIEYIRFVSKVAGINFVFDESELQFNVTIVSEEPVTIKNIMSALIQVLRVHSLIVLEQEENLLITKNIAVQQIPTVVSADIPKSKMGHAPIITRVFRLHNANLSSVATIIKPMMSTTALIEISNETRQLIVSDITTNVDKVGALLASLDAPHSPLEIDSYNSKYIPLEEMISMTTKILSPFSEGNPLIFVPQPETSTIFMVSTPYLIERALTVFADLDVPNKPLPVNATFYLYKILYRTADEIQRTLVEIADEFDRSPTPPIQLITTLKNSKWVHESNSLLFFGDEATLTKIKDILRNIDSQYHENLQYSFHIYKILHANEEELLNALEGISKKLKASEFPNEEVIATIDSIKWIKETNSFIYTGTYHGITEVTNLLQALDQIPTRPGKTGYSFYIYKLEHSQGDVALDNIHRMSENLSSSGIPNTSLIQTLNNITWVKETNSLLITGPTAAVEEAKAIIAHFDIAPTKPLFAGKTSFFAYKPTIRTAKEIQSDLSDMAEDLKASGLIDPNLYLTISTMRYVESNNTLLFTGPEESLDQVKSLLKTIDAGEGGPIKKIGELTFMIYKPKYISTQQLMSSLQNFANDLAKSETTDKDLIKTLETMRFVKETNSILFTGTTETLTKVEAILKKFDSGAFATQGPSTFVIYKPKYQTGPELISILCDFEQNLAAAGASDAHLFAGINNVKWIEKTSSLLISGDADTVKKIEDLLVKFDQPSKEGLATAIESIENTSFLVYKLQYQPGSAIQAALKQVGSDIAKTATPTNQALLNAINSLQWIQVTNSLLATGDQGILTKLRELIGSLDVPLRQVYIEVLVISTSVSNAQTFGLQWGGQIQFLTKTAGGITNMPAANNVAGTPASNGLQGALQPISATTFPTPQKIPLFGQGFDLGVIGDIIMHKGRSFISLGSLINALQTDNDSAVVFNPKIITQDNNTSTIFVGDNIPYTGSNVTINSGGQANNTNITSLEYINVGFNLSLTPTLGNGDVVTLDITTNISAVSNTNVNGGGTQGGSNGIQTTQTNMTTRVHVPDNHFVILSGLINDNITHFRSSIPCLGGLPVIGLAFSENDRLSAKKNLIFFLRPHIINSFNEYKELTDKQENTFRENAGLPILKEEMDQYIDLVKTPENE